MQLASYLDHLCQHLGLEKSQFQVNIDASSDAQVVIQVDVPEDEIGLFIGYRGENLTALQRLLRVIFRDQFGDKSLMLNINQYRQERTKQLQEKAREIGLQVLSSGRPYRFPYLSSYERYLVHATISSDPELAGAESISEGEDQERRLIIRTKSDSSESR